MTVALHVNWEFRLDPPAATAEELHDLGGRLMVELLKLERADPAVFDSTVSTEFDRGILRIEILVRGVDQFQVTEQALAVVRSAVHAVQLATPRWPTAEHLMPIEFQTGQLSAMPVNAPVIAA